MNTSINLSRRPSSSAAVTSHWFVFRVRPRHEKTVALQLIEKGQECLLPLMREKRNWGKRVTEVELPLFPGYVFCRSERFRLLPILQTPGVIDVLRAGNSPIPVASEEIEALQRAIGANARLEPCPYFTVGQQVKIMDGPLAGITGLVVEVRNSRCLVLSITLLQRSVRVQIEPEAIVQAGRQYVIWPETPRTA